MKKFLRFTFWLVIILIALALLISLLAPPFLKAKIENRLSHLAGDSVSINSLSIQHFPLGLKIRDAHFHFHQPGDSLLLQWHGQLSELHIEGINWWQAWRHNNWELKYLEIGRGELWWEVTTVASEPSQKDSASGDKASFLLQKLDVDELKLHLKRDSTTIQLQVSATVNQLGFTPEARHRWHYERINIHSDSAYYQNEGSDYDLSYRALDYDSRQEELRLWGLRMEPRLSQTDWDRKYRYRKSRIRLLAVPQIRLSEFALDSLQKGIYAHKLTADSAHIEIFSDQRRNRGPEHKPLPSEMITKIPFPVHLDSVDINFGSLLYQFIGQARSDRLARLSADQMQLRIYPLSNLGHGNSADVNIDLDMRMMNHPHMRLRAKCFADRPDHDFEFEASLSATPFATFNPLFYPGMGVEVKEGYCEQLRVWVAGNDYGCQGDLDIAYQNLEISMADGKSTTEHLTSELREKAANWIILNEDNRLSSNNGTVKFDRPQNIPFIGYWWRGIESGLMDAIMHFKSND